LFPYSFYHTLLFPFYPNPAHLNPTLIGKLLIILSFLGYSSPSSSSSLLTFSPLIVLTNSFLDEI
jgi:hypothetical protein